MIPSVRLALISQRDQTTTWSDNLKHVVEAQVTIQANSMVDAVPFASEFDAVLTRSKIDAYAALQDRKHVFVDSTVVENLHEMKELMEYAETSGVSIRMGGWLRHTPANRMIGDHLQRGTLGLPGFLRLHSWTPVAPCSLAALVYREIDLAIHFFGGIPTSVYAVARKVALDHYSYLQVHLGFRDGGMALIDFTNSLPMGQSYQSLSLIGSKGAAYSDDHDNMQLLFLGADPHALLCGAEGGFKTEIRMWMSALLQTGNSNDHPKIHNEMILSTYQVIDAIRQSVDTKQVIDDPGDVCHGPD